MLATEERMGEHVPNPNEAQVQCYSSAKNHSFTRFNHESMPFYVHDDSIIQSLAESTNFDEALYHVVTTDAFEGYARNVVRPNFNKISRKVLKQKIIETYSNMKKDLKVELLKFDGHVSITCDLWSTFGGEDHYVCIICHWSKHSCCERRVIGFEMLYPYDHVDVASKVVQVLDDFNLKKKVCSISFDDAISREKCMEHLVNEFDFEVLELFSHDRTYAHLLDLCAQHFVDQLASFIFPITELVRWLRFSPGNRDKFRTLCRKAGLKPRKFYLDLVKDWRSILCHLQLVYKYRDVLTKLCNECVDHSPLIDCRWEWDAVSAIISFLGKLSEISDKFRWAYDACCHLVIQDCITIVRMLKIYESDPRFCSVVKNVRSKWMEVFPEIPTIYCVAAILDPRIKVEGLRQLLVYYYKTLDVKNCVAVKVANSEKALQQLHAHYSNFRKSETKLTLTSGEGNNNNLSSALEFNVIMNVIKRRRVDEIGRYLYQHDIPDIPDDNDIEYFEILQWWEMQKDALPVLSKIAKEVLCIPISSTIPNPWCCPGKRVLDEKRSRLKPSLIKVCICKKDWDLAKEGYQGADEDRVDDALISSDSEVD